MAVRVALLGAGAVSEIVAERAYPKLSDIATVVAVVDQRAERAAAMATALGARAYSSLAEALAAEEVDAVDIRLPHPAHAAAAYEAIAAGKHVLVEKPLATDAAEAAGIVEAATKAGVVLSVAENYQFFEAVHAARRALDAGVIGEVLLVRSHRVCEVAGIWARDGWRTDATRGGGGVLLDQCTHHTNLLRTLVGDITHVHAYASTRREGWVGEDSAVVNCRFESGLIGSQFYSWGTATPEIGAEAYVYGSLGSLEVRVTYDSPGGGVVVFRPNREPEWVHTGGDYFDTFLPTVEDWVRSCAGEHAPGMTGELGVRDLRVVDAAYRSVVSGREERVLP